MVKYNNVTMILYKKNVILQIYIYMSRFTKFFFRHAFVMNANDFCI